MVYLWGFGGLGFRGLGLCKWSCSYRSNLKLTSHPLEFPGSFNTLRLDIARKPYI